MLKTWKANELVTLDSFADYRHGAPAMKRVIVRHVTEPSAQRLLVEKGDVDLTRNLTPDQIKGVAGNADLAVDANPTGTLMYLAANAAHPILGDPRVSKALRHSVDYEGMAGSFLAGQQRVHQAVWPSGLWGALDETPYSLDVDAAKALLAEAGHPNGFKVRLDTLTNSPFPEVAQSIQSTLAKAGIEAEIVTAEGKTLWPMYRARKHELIFYANLDWTGGPGRLDVFYDGIVEPVTGLILVDAALADEWEIFDNAVSHLILPSLVLATFALAYNARMTRSFMLDQEYVLTARVKGVSEFAVIWRHAFRNVLVQLITIIGLTYASLLEGSVLTETVFSWPGIGQYITTSLFNGDMPAVLGGTIVVGICFVGINMFSDLLYRLVDPRARA